MEFELTSEQRLIRDTVDDFFRNELTPGLIEKGEREGRPPEGLIRKLAYDLGILGPSIPPPYGPGLDTVSCVLIMETASRYWTGFMLSVLDVPDSLYAYPIYKYGTDQQKAKYLPPIVSGEALGAYALTEPNAGSLAVNQQTAAVLAGDYWVLNGAKTFITNCDLAKFIVLFAKTARGISAFIVESSFPGFLWKKIEKIGQEVSPFGFIYLDNCKVPKENLLGEEGGGYKIALDTLDSGRVYIAAQALGIADAALTEVLTHVRQRMVADNEPLAKKEIIQKKIWEMMVDIEASRILTYKVAQLKDAGLSFKMFASMAKLRATETACRVTNEAVQIFGGYGYCEEYVVSRLWREARALPLYEGASEIQRGVIARSLSKVNWGIVREEEFSALLSDTAFVDALSDKIKSAIYQYRILGRAIHLAAARHRDFISDPQHQAAAFAFVDLFTDLEAVKLMVWKAAKLNCDKTVDKAIYFLRNLTHQYYGVLGEVEFLVNNPDYLETHSGLNAV